MERNFKGGRNGTTAPSHLPLQGHAPPDSQLAVMTEVTPDCANDRIGACMGLHIDPERPRKLTYLCKVHVCPSTLRCLEQFSRPLEIFSRLSLELTQDPVEHFAEAFAETTRWKGPSNDGLAALSGLTG